MKRGQPSTLSHVPLHSAESTLLSSPNGWVRHKERNSNTYRSLFVAERELRGLPNAMVRWVLGPVTERLINVGARMSEFGGAAEL